ncbi:hypothetical protein [Gorillibacterium sp. CAU 1737]|uniref:hypothetical protein n=1 Tax=Gorillibacterium sp. CAU 1737 TaxID=3140362 RepID=UPI003260402D
MLREGYQIKYNTIGGIRSWIEVALDREALLELAEGKQAVEVRLIEEEKAKLEGVLSHGWHIASATPEDNGEEFYVIVKPNHSYADARKGRSLLPKLTRLGGRRFFINECY